MMLIGPVERGIYKLREEHPLVIPQFDPDKFDVKSASEAFRQIREMGIENVAMGGTILDASGLQRLMDIAIKDFDLSVIIYLTNTSVGVLKGVKNKSAVYWMTVLNAENPFYLRDVLVMNSLSIVRNGFEPIPTTYVFDDRDYMGAANWLARAVHVPREHPYVSLSLALAAQYSGSRFYIMGGGSGSKLPPPYEHVKLVSKRSRMFLIPTSGIRTVAQAETLFRCGADAIHLGKLIETPGGLKILKDIVEASKKYPGKNFYDIIQCD